MTRGPSPSPRAESAATIDLPGGVLAYLLRRSPRARAVRLTIDARRGVVVTVPARPASRNGLEEAVADFLREREPWIRRHLDRHARERAAVAARGGVADGAEFRFRGLTHRLRIDPAAAGQRRSTVERHGSVAGDELRIVSAAADRRPLERVLRDWLVERAASGIERDIVRHAPALAVRPAAVTLRDPRTRWGSAGPTGRIMLSWRLVLAPPEALETVVVHELAHLRVPGHGADFWALVAARRPDHRRWRRWLHDHAFELRVALEPPDG